MTCWEIYMHRTFQGVSLSLQPRALRFILDLPGGSLSQSISWVNDAAFQAKKEYVSESQPGMLSTPRRHLSTPRIIFWLSPQVLLLTLCRQELLSSGTSYKGKEMKNGSASAVGKITENLGLHRGPAEHLPQSRRSFSVDQYWTLPALHSCPLLQLLTLQPFRTEGDWGTSHSSVLVT